jgi:hypothetical protein
MKKSTCALLVSIVLLTPTALLANSYSNPYGSYENEGTHYVQSYEKKDGTFVEGHRSGNPGSGIHCEDNVCD